MIIKTRERNIIALTDKAYKEGYLTDQEFKNCITDMLISENGYVTDCGTNTQVNAEVVLRLKNKIDKHPLLWKLLFMIA